MGSPLNSIDMEPYVLPLRRILGELKPKLVLEVGIGYDAYSTQIWLEDGEVYLTTVDKEDWDGWTERIHTERWQFLKGQSEEVLPELIEKKLKYDLIYIDGDHAYEGVKADIINSMGLVTDGVILIDDYGVTRGDTAVDIVDYKVVAGYFGIKQAVDELFDKTWERVFTHIPFGNGGVAFRRKNVKAKSR